MREEFVLSVLLQSRPKVVGRELPFLCPQPLPPFLSNSQPLEVQRHGRVCPVQQEVCRLSVLLALPPEAQHSPFPE